MQLRPGNNLLALSAINLLLVYTHYYGWLVIAAEAAFLVLWDRDKLPDFLIAAAVLLLCFSPWVYAVTLAAEQGKGLAQNIGWVARPRLADVVQFFALLNAPFYFRQSSNQVVYARWGLLAGFVIFGLPLVALSWRLVRQRYQQEEQSLSAPKVLDPLFRCTLGSRTSRQLGIATFRLGHAPPDHCGGSLSAASRNCTQSIAAAVAEDHPFAPAGLLVVLSWEPGCCSDVGTLTYGVRGSS